MGKRITWNNGNSGYIHIYRGICLKPYTFLKEIKKQDYLIISVKDTSIERDIHENVIIFERYKEQIGNSILGQYRYSMDYFHLKYSLSEAKDSNMTTLFTGSSYGLFGIYSGILKNTVNLSLTSQDLYYSVKGIYEVCRENENIKNIVLVCSYYYFFSDLSKTENPGERSRISRVYYPLYQDMHNCILLQPKENILFQSSIFDIEHVLELFSMQEYKKQYFNKERRRILFSNKTWKDKEKSWEDLTGTEKEVAGLERTLLHNKNLKRQHSLEENIQLFHELSVFCNDKNINLLLVVPPATKYYCKNLSVHFKEIFYQVLNGIDSTIHVLDLYDNEYFEDEDFIDVDHLGDSGAIKMTYMIEDILREINFF